MLSTFQVTTSVWAPERCTAGFAPSEKMRVLVAHAVVPCEQVTTGVNAAELSVPALPRAPVHVALFHETSAAAHVVPPPAGGLNDTDAARSDSLSCFVVVPSTMRSIETAAADAAVGLLMFVTLNETPVGTVILACSLTVTDAAVV